MSLATSGLTWKAIAMLVRGPRASTLTLPGSLLILSAINSAALLSNFLPYTIRSKFSGIKV